VLVLAALAAANPGYGPISGAVLDPSGTPQMGASFWLISEDAGCWMVMQILSNQHGAFFTDHPQPQSLFRRRDRQVDELDSSNFIISTEIWERLKRRPCFFDKL
jgi:hypothetical protein